MSESDDAGNQPPPNQGRRRRPPIIDLEATEVGAEGKRTRAERSRAKPRKAQSGAWRERFPALEWARWAAPAFFAGAVGVLAGVAIAYVLIAGRAGDAQLDAVVKEIGALSSRIEALGEKAQPAFVPDGLGAQLERLTAALGAAEKRLAAIEGRIDSTSPDLSAIEQQSVEIEKTLGQLRAALTQAGKLSGDPADRRMPAALDALTDRIAGLEERVASLATASRPPEPPAALAEIAALNALASAIESGRPFARELETAHTLTGERAAALAPLESDASKGLPAIATLAKRFSELAPALVRGPEPEGDFLSRLLANAARLVEVRPVGEPEGSDAGAVVARIETRLGRDDLSGALAETTLLPESARALAADWIAAATRRRDAERTVREMIDRAIARPEERKAS
jgi:hypothetical protein